MTGAAGAETSPSSDKTLPRQLARSASTRSPLAMPAMSSMRDEGGSSDGGALGVTEHTFLPRRPFPFHRSLTAPHAQAGKKLGALRHPFPSGEIESPLPSPFTTPPQEPQQETSGQVEEGGLNESDKVATSIYTNEGEAGPSTPRIGSIEPTGSAPSDLFFADKTADEQFFPSLLADTLQLPISTLLQVIPPHLLDPSHERLSAMSLQVPVTSIEALLEACRTLNWLFARVAESSSPSASLARSTLSGPRRTLTQPPEDTEGETWRGTATSLDQDHHQRARSASAFAALERAGGASMQRSDTANLPRSGLAPRSGTAQFIDFDIFELTQRVADMAAGQAAERHVDLVLLQNHNGDDLKSEQKQQQHDLGSSLSYSVKGDEGATRFAMVQLVSRSLERAGANATVEMSLQISETEENSPRCTFSVTIVREKPMDIPEEWTAPLEDVATAAGASIEKSLLTPEKEGEEEVARHGLCQTMSFHFQRGGPLAEAGELPPRESEARQRFLPSLRLAEEPSAKDLGTFIDQDLKGRKVAIHGRPSSVFVGHLMALLHRCGCQTASLSATESSPSAALGATWADKIVNRSTRTAVALSGNRPSLISYPSGLGMGHEVDKQTSDSSPVTAVLDPVTGVPLTLQMGQQEGMARGGLADGSADGSSSSLQDKDRLTPFSFIIIDDDPEILNRELLRIRSGIATLKSAMDASPSTASPMSPSSASARQPRGKNGGEDSSQHSNDSLFHSTQAILYFCSLGNFRIVRDTIQPIVESASQSNTPLPEIIVVPKPAGRRRILTAMHTAIHKPLVDPFFSPIATSPLSPSAAAALQGTGLGDPSRPSSNAPSPSIVDKAAFSSSTIARPALAKGSRKQREKREKRTLGRNAPLHIDLPLERSLPQERDGKQASQAAHDGSAIPASSKSGAAQEKMEQEAEGFLSPATITKSEGTRKAGKAGATPRASTSPLPTDALEYFSETAARMGSRGAAGMMIQSPDGRPAGIFFQPKTSASSHGSRTPSSIPNRSNDESEGKRLDAASDLKHAQADAAVRAPNGELGGKRQSMAGGGSADMKDGQAAPTTRARPSEGLQLPAYPSGSMFEPQIEVESVLQGDRPPVATPLHQSLGGTGASSPRKQEDYVTLGRSVPHSLAAAATQLGQQTSSSPLPKKSTDGKKVLKKSPKTSSKKRETSKTLVTTPASPSSPPAITAATTPSSPLGAPDAAVHATRQTFTNANLHAPVRPSAQPQSGLLIGAGFTPTQKRSMGPKKASKQIKVLPPIKVLIVEDNPINIKILSMFFDRKKIQYDVARDGREAVDRWREGGFHLILMDIQLPVMDGIEATKEIRRHERSANIGVLTSTTPVGSSNPHDQYGRLEAAPSPAAEGTGSQGLSSTSLAGLTSRASVIIVALTASVLNSDRVAALAAGCNDFLNKPVDLRWLERKVIEWGSMQYLIGFKAGIAGDDVILSTATAAANGRHDASSNGAALTLARGNGEVRKAFADGPDSKARELAGRLHIGGLRKDTKRQQLASPTSPA